MTALLARGHRFLLGGMALRRIRAGGGALATNASSLFPPRLVRTSSATAELSGSLDFGPLIITPAAIRRLQTVFAKYSEEPNGDAPPVDAAPSAAPGPAFRVSVYEGGCKGLEYKFQLDPHANIATDDVVIRRDGVLVLVDGPSIDKLRGATLDFVADLQGELFAITNNPLAAAACGCGSSFAAKEPQ